MSEFESIKRMGRKNACINAVAGKMYNERLLQKILKRIKNYEWITFLHWKVKGSKLKAIFNDVLA